MTQHLRLMGFWESYKNLFQDKEVQFFEPRYFFPNLKEGFDIVIANPPYVRQERIQKLKPLLKEQYTCYTGTADLYVYFYERSFELLRDGGILTFISSNKYFRAGYGAKLRDYLSTNARVVQVIDFGDAPVFKAIAYPSIIVLQKSDACDHEVLALNWTPGPRLENFASIFRDRHFLVKQSRLTDDGWRLESPEVLQLLDKLRSAGPPLGEYVKGRFYRGILTGLNEAFVVDGATKDRLIAEHGSSAEVLKPFLRGRDVKRWRVEFGGVWLIKIESSENKKHAWSEKSDDEAEKVFAQTLPAIYRHLMQFREKLIKREDQGKYFWELRSCKYWGEFDEMKIVWGNLSLEPKFSFLKPGFYLNAPSVLAVSDSKYLLGILNSSICKFIVSQSAAVRQGGFLEYKPMYVSHVAIPENVDKTEVESLVGQLLNEDLSEEDKKMLENELDFVIFKLFKLSDEEIELITQRCV